MKWKKYPKYKDSGIEWIGEIPEHWEVKAIRRVFKVLNGATPKSGEPLYWDGDIAWATPDDLGKNDSKIINETQRKITKEGYESCGTSLVSKGSILLSTRAPIGHLAIAGMEICTNQGCRSLVFISNESADYFYYQFFASKQELESFGQGSTFKELTRDKLLAIKVIVPNLKEQTQIAQFLDHETSRIERLIEKKNRQIELLKEKRSALITHAVTKGLNPNAKMKDSGIEWIGEIPEHWETKKLKYLTRIISKGTTPSTIGKELFESGKIRFIKAENILHTNQLSKIPEFYINEETNILLKRSELLEEDILIVIAGATIGKVAILTKDFLPANTNQAVCFIRLKKHSAIINYIHYYLQSDLTKILIWLTSVQSAQPNLSMENISNFITIIPPKNEQTQIAQFLGKETSKIDALISKIQLSIERLKEYRTALISAAVTGKIDVRNWNNEGAICQ